MMFYALLSLVYVGVGLLATLSPFGIEACFRYDVPAILYLLFWPIFFPFCLLLMLYSYLNDKLENAQRS